RIRVDGEMPKCPICLDSPVAAKITKCGHIYCWPCFLHYLSLSDNEVRTCPICYNPVSKNDLKSVSFIPQIGVEIGTKMEMRLMVRMKDANTAFPLDKSDGWEDKFCKILQVAPTAVIQNVLIHEKFELDFTFDADPFAPEACFIQQALNFLDERRIALLNVDLNFCNNLTLPANGLIPPDCYIRFPDVSNDGPPAIGSADMCGKKPRNDSVSSNSSGGYEDPTLVQVQSSTAGQGHAYFYQMSDGRNVFLHPMNMAMLWRELGTDVEKWPQVLTFEVIDIESKSATEENRKRLKFCRHLPLNAPFELVEVNLDEFGISPEVKADFASQLHQRQQRRRNRAKEEKMLERKQRELEAQELNKLRHMPKLSSTQEFPAFGTSIAEQEFALAVIQEEIAAAASGAIGTNVEECKAEETFANVFQASTSFAQMAGKAPLKKSPTYPIGGGTAWGKSPVAGITPNAILARHSDSENEGEDYTPVPNYRASVSDAIERALAGLDLSGTSGFANNSELAASPGSGNKKKKSKKGKVLFATGMGFN
ncbi:RING finger protein 10, partial [Orchesella cincta]